MAMLRQESTNIDDLSDDVLLEIFSYLSAEEIATSVSQTSQRWQELSRNSYLWSTLKCVPPVDMSEDDIIDMFSDFPNLKYFLIKQKVDISNVIQELISCFDDIRALIFKTKEKVHLFTVPQMTRTYSKLKCFELFCAYYYVNVDYARLVGERYKNCRITINPGTNKETIKPLILNNMYNVQVLTFTEKMTLPLFHMICSCKHLKYLLLCNTCPTSNCIDLRYLAMLTNLTTLQICGFCTTSECIVEEDFLKFVRYPNLTRLEIVNGGIALDTLLNSFLFSSPNLVHLNVQRNALEDRHLENIRYCKRLEYVDISSNINLTDNGLRIIAEACSELKFLDMYNCPKTTDRFVMMLQSSRKLEILIIEGLNYRGTYYHLLPEFFENLSEFHVRHLRNDQVLDNLRRRSPNLSIIKCTSEHSIH